MSNSILLPNKPFKAGTFINNHWHLNADNTFEVKSPLFDKVIGVVSETTQDELNNVVDSAKEAFKTWGQAPIKERTQVMFRFREELLANLDIISELVSLENGKTIGESKAGILKGVEVLEYALSLQNADLGGRMEVSRGVFCEYRKEPLGVVSSITPFNFPAMVPMWTIPITLTLGNCMVWKPSEKTPLTALLIAECLEKAGLPKGVFSVVQGGADVVNGILEHPDIPAISFVGSTKIAKLVYAKGSSHHKRVLALGGAKNHIILLPDADPELSGPGISDSFTGCAGQRCMAASVLLAVGEVDHIIEKIKSRAQSLELGKDMGTMITKEQVEFLHKAISDAEAKGAKVILDGRNAKAPSEYENGYWLGPTILDNVAPDSDAAKIELFGPILSIVRCKNITQALEIENSNPYGNACSVFTSSGSMYDLISKKAKAAMIGINIGVPVPREPFSFGGLNESKFGHGDVTGVNSLNFWTNIKKITTKWQVQSDQNWMS